MKIRITKRNKDFVEYIDRAVQDGKTTYMDAVLQYCEMNDIDPATVKSMIPKPIKEKIEAEARKLNFIKNTGQELPIE